MEDRTEELSRQNRLILDAPYLTGVLDAMPNFVAVLNQQRQAVFINRALKDFLGYEANGALPEIRMGVVFSCRFAEKSKGGCGASEYCTMCGANLAIRTALKGEPCTKDCTVSVETHGGVSSLDFSVTARPMEVGGMQFVIFTAVDIEGQKRRRCLENVFFKDVLTLASGIRGIALSLNEQAPQGLDSITETLFLASDNLVDEIESQRDLLAAEAKELKVVPKDMRTLWFLRKAREDYGWSLAAEGKALEIDPETVDEPFCSDPDILKRALITLVKNALENTPPGKTVWVGCRSKGELLEFWVKNRAVMPKDIQLRVFKRFFSTKGVSTGIGTYGSQLLVENYLGGEVDFSSEPDFGTEFRIRIPREA